MTSGAISVSGGLAALLVGGLGRGAPRREGGAGGGQRRARLAFNLLLHLYVASATCALLPMATSYAAARRHLPQAAP